ncbi:MAG: response regulator [Planctomycetota bacterium]|nr:response regulator [Planctomycetota bacterium]
MLVLERPVGSSINVGGLIQVTIQGVRGSGRVKVAIAAPPQIRVWRSELEPRAVSTPEPEGAWILAIEDDASYGKLLQAAFQIAGISRFEVVTTIHEAQDRLASLSGDQLPACVLIDYHLPTGPGVELVRWVRNEGKYARLPLVLLSGDTSEQCVDACLQSGANAYMEKQGEFDALVQTARSVVAFWCGSSVVA